MHEAKKIRIEEDVTVYKVLRVFGESKNKYLSPYYVYPWVISKRKRVPKFELAHLERTVENFGFINSGAYHSFKTLDAANTELIRLVSWEKTRRNLFPYEETREFVIGEFVIPKDSDYVYVGKYDHAEDCYASSDLIFKKVL